eukprot:gene9852-2175_t
MSKAKITKEKIENCYGVPIHEACLILRLETKELQSLCREYGIKRWPKTRKKTENGNVFQQFHYDTHKSHQTQKKKLFILPNQTKIGNSNFSISTPQQQQKNVQKRFKKDMKLMTMEIGAGLTKVSDKSVQTEVKEAKSGQETMSINNLCN